MDRVTVTPESPKDPLDALSGWTGRLASVPRPVAPWLTRRQRIVLMTLVVAGHAGLGVMLDLGSRVAPEDVDATQTTLVFLSPPAPERPPEPPVEAPRPAPTTATPPRPRPASPAGAAPSPAASPAQSIALQVVEVPAAPAERLALFRADGSIELPDEVKDQLEGVLDPDRAFSFQYPGLIEGGTFMDRQPALIYEETRFEQYWKPQQDILTEFLERAVEAARQEHPRRAVVERVAGQVARVAHLEIAVSDDGGRAPAREGSVRGRLARGRALVAELGVWLEREAGAPGEARAARSPHHVAAQTRHHERAVAPERGRIWLLR